MRRAAAIGTLWAFGLGLAGPAWATARQAGPASPGQSDLTINHDALPCVVTELAPMVDAQVAPAPEFERGYVYFKAAGTEDFYYTSMKGPADNLQGVLPRPLPQTKAIDYKVRARDIQAKAKETPEYAPPVVPGNACKTKGLAVGKGGAGLTIGLTREGQDPVPRGFDKRDIAFIILFGGATVTLAQALAGTGGSAAAGGTTGAKAGGGQGGVSKGVLIGAGVAVAAGAALAISNNRGGGSNPTATPTATATPTRTATPQPTSTPTAVAQFVAAVANWSGPGDVDVQILNAGNQSVGSNLPAGCESTMSRSEQVLLQGAPPGAYRVMLSAKTCGSGTPTSIATAVSVQSNGAPKCPNSFIDVPVGGAPVQACSFTLP